MDSYVAKHAPTGDRREGMVEPKAATPFVVAGIFLLSVSVLVYEIALTRLFSVMMTYHYVFLVVSMALLGLAFGGVFEDRLKRERSGLEPKEPALGQWTALVAAAMAVAVILMTKTGLSANLLFLTLIVMPPFFFGGVTLAAAFRRFASQSPRLYAFDLAGAALGSLAVVWALNRFGGVNTVLFAAAVAALSSLSFVFHRRPRGRHVWLPASVFVASGLLFVLNLGDGVIGDVPLRKNPDKEMSLLLNDSRIDAEIIDTRWSAFGRTDLVRQSADPSLMGLYIDGAAGTSMFRWNGSLDDTTGMLRELKHGFTGSFPLALMEDSQKDSALIIGPGGGRDVLVNLLWGVRNITAVEVNPDFVALMRKYEDYNGGLYTRTPNVRVVVEEGRNFLKRSDDRYDIIMLTLPITKSSRSFQGYALTENFLFTKESFQDYFDHLTPEGTLIIVAHSLPESVRLLTTALAAFADRGIEVTDAMKRLYVLGNSYMPVVVFQKRPFERERAQLLHSSLHLSGFDGRTSYVPYARQQVIRLKDADTDSVEGEWLMMNQSLLDLAHGDMTFNELIQEFPLNVQPATDDRPFFFSYRRGLPVVLNQLLWLSFLFVGIVVLGPAALRRRQRRSRLRLDLAELPRHVRMPASIVVLFLGIGIGFMLIEISLLHKLQLFLGKPTLALSLLLFALLIGSGLGSIASGRVQPKHRIKAIWLSAAVVGLIVPVATIFLPPLFEAILRLGATRFVVAALAVMLIGFPMGFPFPMGIRLLKERSQERDIPWMWAVNGAASVFGAVLAVSAAVLWGYSASFWLGAASYLWVAAVIVGSRRLRPQVEKESTPVLAGVE